MVYTAYPTPCKGKKPGWNASLTWYRPPRPPQAPDPKDTEDDILTRLFFTINRAGSWGQIAASWKSKTWDLSIAQMKFQSGKQGWFYYGFQPSGWMQTSGTPTSTEVYEYRGEGVSHYLEDGTWMRSGGWGQEFPLLNDPDLPPRINPYTNEPTTLYHYSDYPGTKLQTVAGVAWLECYSKDVPKCVSWMLERNNPRTGYFLILDGYLYDPNHPNSPPAPPNGFGGRPPDTQNIKEILTTRNRNAKWQIKSARYLIDPINDETYIPDAPSDEHRLIGASFLFCGCADGEHQCGGCCLACCEIAAMLTEKTDAREWS